VEYAASSFGRLHDVWPAGCRASAAIGVSASTAMTLAVSVMTVRMSFLAHLSRFGWPWAVEASFPGG
jgi:hypothetical protein